MSCNLSIPRDIQLKLLCRRHFKFCREPLKCLFWAIKSSWEPVCKLILTKTSSNNRTAPKFSLVNSANILLVLNRFQQHRCLPLQYRSLYLSSFRAPHLLTPSPRRKSLHHPNYPSYRNWLILLLLTMLSIYQKQNHCIFLTSSVCEINEESRARPYDSFFQYYISLERLHRWPNFLFGCRRFSQVLPKE